MVPCGMAVRALGVCGVACAAIASVRPILDDLADMVSHGVESRACARPRACACVRVCVGVWACGRARVGVRVCARVCACVRARVCVPSGVGVWASGPWSPQRVYRVCGRQCACIASVRRSWAAMRGRVGVWACGRVGVWACGRVGVWLAQSDAGLGFSDEAPFRAYSSGCTCVINGVMSHNQTVTPSEFIVIEEDGAMSKRPEWASGPEWEGWEPDGYVAPDGTFKHMYDAVNRQMTQDIIPLTIQVHSNGALRFMRGSNFLILNTQSPARALTAANAIAEAAGGWE